MSAWMSVQTLPQPDYWGRSAVLCNRVFPRPRSKLLVPGEGGKVCSTIGRS